MGVLREVDMPPLLYRETELSVPPLLYREVDGVIRLCREDGEPVTQSIPHYMELDDLGEMLKGLLEDRPEFFPTSDVLIEWGTLPHERCAPDYAVFADLPERFRRAKTLRLWEIPSGPVFVLEELSDNTVHIDMGPKYAIYENILKVPEYFVCISTPASPLVWGYRLAEGRYEPIEADAKGRVWSEQLQAWFGQDEDGMLRVWNAADLPEERYLEVRRRARETEARVEAAARRAEEEACRAEEQTRRAEEEARRRAEAEAEVQRLRERLAELERG